MSNYHTPVLLNESVDGIIGDKNGVYVDVTFGGGGHSREILKRIDNGKIIAFDQDEDAEKNTIEDERFLFIRQNFRFMKHFLKYYEIPKVDGIIADLGISSHQIDTPGRGFSFRYKGDLDLRMNQVARHSAKEIIQNYTEEELKSMFYTYGEIKNTNKLVAVILKARESKKIERIEDFLDVIQSCIPQKLENKYLARVFQALRMEVNREVEFLKDFLEQTVEVLKEKGRLSVITYHSLEDRLVKNFIKAGNFEGKVETDLFGRSEVPLRAVNKSVIVPGETELQENNRARSAKLRIAEKV